ncbi:unnamed protein product [Cuscuta campestris]|uniref:Uncharacterized protein n=1 Tax=Cuscuta campestris TaxID=132261 RepID=A0A484M0K7_9ASTE|nr:unnamed protein product [Cuscuta campestris]
MAQAMASSLAALDGGSLKINGGSARWNSGSAVRVGFSVRPGGLSVVRAQQVPGEAETSRRALLGVAAAGLVSGSSFVQSGLAEVQSIKVGPPPPPSGGLRKSSYLLL